MSRFRDTRLVSVKPPTKGQYYTSLQNKSCLIPFQYKLKYSLNHFEVENLPIMDKLTVFLMLQKCLLLGVIVQEKFKSYTFIL